MSRVMPTMTPVMIISSIMTFATVISECLSKQTNIEFEYNLNMSGNSNLIFNVFAGKTFSLYDV